MKPKLLTNITILLFTAFFAAYTGYTTYKNVSEKSRTNAAEVETVIYDNSLAEGWVSWSWNSTIDFSSQEVSTTPPAAIKFTPGAYGGLYVHTDASIPVNSETRIEFSLFATQPNTKLVLRVFDQNNQVFPKFYNLEEHGGIPPVNQWKTYSISLREAISGPGKLNGVILQETGNTPWQTTFVDSIKVFSTEQSVPTTPGISQTIYDDSLTASWVNWSWDSTVLFGETKDIYQGSRSMSFTPKKGWAGLYLHTDHVIESKDYASLSFAAKGSNDKDQYAVVLFGEYNELLGTPLPLTRYGTFSAANWNVYTVPLTDIIAENKKIKGVGLFSLSGKVQSTVYLDNISLLPKQGGAVIPKTMPDSQAVSPTQTVSPSPSIVSQRVDSGPNPFASNNFYVHGQSHAKKTVEDWRAQGRNDDASQVEKIANTAWAQWAVSSQYLDEVRNYILKATEQNSLPVIVSYNIPGRDCGLYSQGGSTYEGYKSWIQSLADVIGDRKAVVILEPDALGLDCLQNENTYSLLRHAVDTLETKAGVSVYIDAASWVSPETLAQRLQSVGIGKAQGFVLNTSGYNRTEDMVSLGKTISAKVGGKHFVIDTSRNGKGPLSGNDPEPWCNPPDRALGHKPTANTGHAEVDAYFWIKMPGESDGSCRSFPSAGTWVPDYALGLAQRASY